MQKNITGCKTSKMMQTYKGPKQHVLLVFVISAWVHIPTTRNPEYHDSFCSGQPLSDLGGPSVNCVRWRKSAKNKKHLNSATAKICHRQDFYQPECLPAGIYIRWIYCRQNLLSWGKAPNAPRGENPPQIKSAEFSTRRNL